MQEYYEELWRRLPEDPAAPELAARRRFLLPEVRPGERALDLGCGEGSFTAELLRAGARVVGADIAQAALDRARAHHPELELRKLKLDGPLPFADNEFSLVWASEVIEHVADTARWLSEVRRVLAPQGRLLLTTPAHGRLRLLVGGIARYSEPLGDHLHLYAAGSLRRLLSDFGFAVTRIATIGPPLMRRTLLVRAQR